MTGIVAHQEKSGAGELVLQFLKELERLHIPFVLETKTAFLAGLSGGASLDVMAKQCDLLVVLGGDGTILRVLHQLGGESPPIFGINLGTLGFLTCLGATEIASAAASIANNSYCLSHRTMMCAEVLTPSGVFFYEGLNDVVVSRGERSQLVKVRVIINEDTLTEYYADGLIVATPTGSTAYSLSAGGPILFPDSGSFVITPICPHVLTNRSVVLSDSSTIVLEPVEGVQEIFITVDGQEVRPIVGTDRVAIKKSTKSLKLAMLPGRSFSRVLQQKLKWSGSNV